MRLVMLPVAIGSGRSVFPADEHPTAMQLLRTEALGSLVAVDYAIGADG